MTKNKNIKKILPGLLTAFFAFFACIRIDGFQNIKTVLFLCILIIVAGIGYLIRVFIESRNIAE